MMMTEMMIMMKDVITVNHWWQLLISYRWWFWTRSTPDMKVTSQLSVHNITKKNTKWPTMYCYTVNTLNGMLILELYYRTIGYCLKHEISNVCNIWYRCAHSVQIFYYVQSYQCWATASAWCVCVWHEARWQFFRKCIVCQIWSWVKMKGCTKSFIMIMLNVSKVVEAYCSVLLPWHYQGETHGYFNLTQIEELLLCCCACELLRQFNWSYVWKCFHGYQIDWYFIDVIVMGGILYQCLCKKSHKKCLTVKFPKNCSSFCQLWLQLLQLCSRSNHIDLDSSCSNNLQWFLGQLFDVQTMLQSSFSILQTA